MANATSIIDARRGRPCRGRAGITLAESLIASVVLAMAVVALVGPLCASQQQQSSGEETATAMALAEQLLEEITAKPFDDPAGPGGRLGRESGENYRWQYNSVNDYGPSSGDPGAPGYSDSTSALLTLGTTAVTGAGNGGVYTRQVYIEYRQSPTGSAASNGDFAIVTVKVTTPQQEPVNFSRLMTRMTVTR